MCRCSACTRQDDRDRPVGQSCRRTAVEFRRPRMKPGERKRDARRLRGRRPAAVWSSRMAAGASLPAAPGYRFIFVLHEIDRPELGVGQLLTRKPASVRARRALCPRLHVLFAPTWASRRDQFERWFATLNQKQIDCVTHGSRRGLEQAIGDILNDHNDEPGAFVWPKSAVDTRPSNKRPGPHFRNQYTRARRCA